MTTLIQRRPIRHLVSILCLIGAVGFLTATWLTAITPKETGASSHREAPLISGDPTVDNLDVYAFVSPDKQDSVTLIATWIPFEEPGGGPNFYHFDPNARYLINIDRDGNTRADIIYEWTFSRPTPQNGDTFLYNTGPIGANFGSDSDFNLRQSYTVTKITTDTIGFSSTVLFANELMPPDNIGPRSTPNYAAIAANAVNTGSGPAAGYKEFTGQRDDPFYVDVRSIFDLAGLRPFNNLHAIPLPVEQGQDVLKGFNAHATALQVPIGELVSGSCDNATTNKNCVIGVWSTAERGGIQVSRLGNPLVNEVVMSLALKDIFNSVPPSIDATVSAVVKRVTDPEVAGLMNLLYGSALQPVETSGRIDLVTVFLVGIPTAPGYPMTTQQANSAASPSEQLRLNTAVKPTKGACQGDPLGIFNDDPVDGDDLTAFPNGRRLEDDVTDMALRAVGQGYGPVINGVFGALVPHFKNLSPNNLLGDGVGANDVACLNEFPYVGTPHAGYENNHGGLFGRFFPIITKDGN